jgi:hemerythrin-like domain-containing protein
MQGKEILGQLLYEHSQLRDRLADWTAALASARNGNYDECQKAVGVLRNMCQYLESEVAHHIREEEMVLYAAVRAKLPQLRDLVTELHQEHDVILQALQDVRQELVHFDSTGELRNLIRLATEMIAYLRYHTDREERTLHPAVLREFKEADWWELRRLYVDSMVA